MLARSLHQIETCSEPAADNPSAHRIYSVHRNFAETIEPEDVRMRVPFVDLRAQYLDIQPEIEAAIRRVVDSTAFVGGEQVSSFEAEFAAYCAEHQEPALRAIARRNSIVEAPLNCVGCANGTEAIYLALRGLNIGPGDEVITVSHTFIATAAAVTRA